MDETLEKLTELSCARGSSYIKGPASSAELPLKMAELGVLLLEKSKAIQQLHGDRLKEELIEIQNKVDDMRKVLFACKLIVK